MRIPREVRPAVVVKLHRAREVGLIKRLDCCLIPRRMQCRTLTLLLQQKGEVASRSRDRIDDGRRLVKSSTALKQHSELDRSSLRG